MFDKAIATRVVILRHGEKPAETNNPDLSPLGQQRATMLATELPVLYPNISLLFATARSKASNRTYETLGPLAANLDNRTIDTDFAHSEHADLAHYVMQKLTANAGTTIVICWDHDTIPAMTGIDFGVSGAPTSWANDVYDELWEITWPATGPATIAIRKQPPVSRI